MRSDHGSLRALDAGTSPWGPLRRSSTASTTSVNGTPARWLTSATSAAELVANTQTARLRPGRKNPPRYLTSRPAGLAPLGRVGNGVLGSRLLIPGHTGQVPQDKEHGHRLTVGRRVSQAHR